MSRASAQGGGPGTHKVSTGILLGKIPSPERRLVARELHESMLDLPGIWAPSEVFEHESIAYRLKGSAFVHMAPPLETAEVELHILEGMYALPALREMARSLATSARVTVCEQASHRHSKGGELILHVSADNLDDIFRFVVRLYRRSRGF